MRFGVARLGRRDSVRPRRSPHLGILAAGACSSPRYEPTTRSVNGRTVFIIYFPACPKNASCAAEVIINKQPYEYPSPPPRTIYRTGPLYAVVSDSEARTISGLDTPHGPVLALRIGTDWHLARSVQRPSSRRGLGTGDMCRDDQRTWELLRDPPGSAGDVSWRVRHRLVNLAPRR